MDFRKATTGDIKCLIELRKLQLIDEGYPEVQNIDNELRHYFLSGLTDHSFIAWLAHENQSIIATSGLCFYHLPPTYSNPTGKVAYVTNMFSLKEHRRKGIASILLEKILCEAHSMEYSLVRLHASSDGKKLYTKFGFLPSEGFMALKL